MSQVHAAVGPVLLGGAILFTLAALVAVRRGGGRWLEWMRLAVTTLIGIQVSLGVVALTEASLADRLHILYGVLALAALPFASFFAAEAPPKARAGVFVVAGLVLTGIVWRSTVTA